MSEPPDKRWTVGELLDGDGPELADTVRRQVEAVERQLDGLRRLLDRLTAIGEALEREGEPSIDQLTTTMEATAMHERYYTPGQLERLRRRGDELGEEAIAEAQREWGEIYAALRVERRQGRIPPIRGSTRTANARASSCTPSWAVMRTSSPRWTGCGATRIPSR